MNYSVVFLFLILCMGLQAQEIPTSSESEIIYENEQIDTASQGGKLFGGRPGKAMLYSLVVPATGQAFVNKKLWKVPLVYAAVGGMGLIMLDSRKEFRRFQDALVAEVEGLPHEFDGILDSAEAIKPYRDRARKQYESNIIYFSLIWVLQSVEAYVDAHLIGFDVDEDLSIRTKPAIIPVGNQGLAMGIGISLHF